MLLRYQRYTGVVSPWYGQRLSLSGTVVGYQCRGVGVVIRPLGCCDTVVVHTIDATG